MLGPTVFLATFAVLCLKELLVLSKLAQAEEAEKAKQTPEEELGNAIAQFLTATRQKDCKD